MLQCAYSYSELHDQPIISSVILEPSRSGDTLSSVARLSFDSLTFCSLQIAGTVMDRFLCAGLIKHHRLGNITAAGVQAQGQFIFILILQGKRSVENGRETFVPD